MKFFLAISFMLLTSLYFSCSLSAQAIEKGNQQENLMDQELIACYNANGKDREIQTDCDSYQRQYDTQCRYVDANIERMKKLRNGNNIALKNQTIKSIQQTQRVMRNIRNQATNNGCSVSKVWEEDWNE